MDGSELNRSELVWMFTHPIVILMYVISFSIAFFAPVNYESDYLLLATFVNFMASAFPIINNFATNSAFSELLRLNASVMVFFIPAWIFLWRAAPNFQDSVNHVLKTCKESSAKIFFAHVFPFLSLYMFIDYVFFVRGSDYAIAPFQSSRLFLGLMAPLMFVIAPASAIFFPYLMIVALKKYWGERHV